MINRALSDEQVEGPVEALRVAKVGLRPEPSQADLHPPWQRSAHAACHVPCHHPFMR
jgi:hypothetical protein